MCCNGVQDVARCRWTHARSVAMVEVLLQWQRAHCNGGGSVAMADRCIAMVDRMLQDASAHRFATLTGERTTMNSTTPKYGRYCMCGNKPTETCGDGTWHGRQNIY